MVFDLCAELSYNRHCCLWRIRSNDLQRNLREVWYPALGLLGEEGIDAGHWNFHTTSSFTDRCLSVKKTVGQSTSAMKNKTGKSGCYVWHNSYHTNRKFLGYSGFGKRIPARVMFGFWHFHSALAEVRRAKSRTVESGDAAPRQCHLPFLLGYSSFGMLPC